MANYDRIINLRIDVNKIDKKHLYEGKKGTYLDLAAFVSDQPDQYDNHGFITQQVSKEAREAGEKGAILGNVNRIYENGHQSKKNYAPSKNKMNPNDVDLNSVDDDLPF